MLQSRTGTPTTLIGQCVIQSFTPFWQANTQTQTYNMCGLLHNPSDHAHMTDLYSQHPSNQFSAPSGKLYISSHTDQTDKAQSNTFAITLM